MSNEKQLVGQELVNFLVSRFSLTEAEAIEQIHSSKRFQELPDNRKVLWVGNGNTNVHNFSIPTVAKVK